MPQGLQKALFIAEVFSSWVFQLCFLLCFFVETKTQVCLLCEVILKQNPAFNFFCASFESIIAIEKLKKEVDCQLGNYTYGGGDSGGGENVLRQWYRGSGNIDKTPSIPHDSPLPRGHTLGSDEGRMQHNELMDFVTKLQVKRLEKKDKLSKSKRKLRLVLSDKEGSDSDILAQVDPSKQGRKITQIDEDEGITLVQMGVSTASTYFTTANVPVTTAGAEISTASPEVKTVGDFVDDIAVESNKNKKRLGLVTAVRLQEEFGEEERQRIAHRIQAEEREKYTEVEQARMLIELINQRKNIILRKDGVDIYMLVERKYPLSRGVLTQMLVAKLLVEQNNEMSSELLRRY
ncbi:hypothetical protein Tco_0813206 [Tanacetum coccineum]